MQAVRNYIRNLFATATEVEPINKNSFKRDRMEDEESSDDDIISAYKKKKYFIKPYFPEMTSNDENDKWNKKEDPKVRLIPIQVDRGQPSTSTPNESRSKYLIQSVLMENGKDTPSRTQNRITPRTRVHVDNIEDKHDKRKYEKTPSTIINLIDENDSEPNNESDDEELIILRTNKKSSDKLQIYKRVVSKNDDQELSAINRDSSPSNISLHKGVKYRNAVNSSPKTFNKFIGSVGVNKSYKKTPTPVPKWMSRINSVQRSPCTKDYLKHNGKAKSALANIFDLEEKQNYQELIKSVTNLIKPSYQAKPIVSINVDDEPSTYKSLFTSYKKPSTISIDSKTSKDTAPITLSSDSEVEVVEPVERVNSFRDSLKDKPMVDLDWVKGLENEYKVKKQQSLEKLSDANLECDIFSKLNNHNTRALFELKIKNAIKIPTVVLDDLNSTTEIPELSAEQEKLVNKALGPGNAGQLLIEKFNLRIHRRDLQTLAGLNWLNDEVINFYMNLLMQRCQEQQNLPKVYAANTFFYPKLMATGQAGLKRWTRKVDIFSHDLMVVPVHLGVHWCMSIVDFRRKSVSYLDSMGGRNAACLQALLQYLRDEHRDKKGEPFQDHGWVADSLKDIPQQMNGSDCGMFACTFAEFSARDAPYTFSQADMPLLRKKAALEIIQGKLLL